MKKEIIVLGSTGSIGSSVLNVINKNKNFKIKLLTTKKNVNKILNQAICHNVKDVIIEDRIKFLRYKSIFLKKKIKLHLGIINIKKVLKNKVTYCVNSISGLDGLEPTLNTIPFTKNLLMANKESIICGWHLIKRKLEKHKTRLIPLDSEHFSISELIKNDEKYLIEKIILTASGGPFLNISKKKLSNIKPKDALRHPNWKMGKKITIDSSNMMNKIFEYIEAKKIFNLKNDQISILIHPKSFVHAIVFFKGNLIKFLAHETSMTIPIANALGIKNKIDTKHMNQNFKNLNKINFLKPKIKHFPLLSIINLIPNRTSFFETILITLNDLLVEKFLKNKIKYISIEKILLKLLKKPYFIRFYKLKPRNIYDIKKMVIITELYLEKNLNIYEK